MKVLITGGAGYIGTVLINRLLANYEVEEIVIYDNLSRTNFNLFLGKSYNTLQKLRFVRGEMLDSRSLAENLKGIDLVYHLAARVTTPFANQDPHYFEQSNHWGTAELAYALENSDVKRVVFTSSTSVYGTAQQQVTEDSTPMPTTFYGISKYRAEEQLRRLGSKMDTYILRCGNVYGYSKSMRFDAVINKFMFEANFSKRITIQGDGSQMRPFIHVNLLAEALGKMTRSIVPSGTYNLVDHNRSILDIVDEVKALYPDLEFLFVNQHMNLPSLQVEPDSQLRKYVDYQAKQSFSEDLEAFKKSFAF